LSGSYVLLVEDEAFIAADLACYLEAVGCHVVGPFASLSRALTAVATDRIDLAVLDVNLKGAAVWPVAETLQERRVPFVFITGYAAVEPFPNRFTDVIRLQKPFAERHLLAALAGLCDSDSRRKPSYRNEDLSLA
jgi:DNA-binding NtrC family response regulator